MVTLRPVVTKLLEGLEMVQWLLAHQYVVVGIIVGVAAFGLLTRLVRTRPTKPESPLDRFMRKANAEGIAEIVVQVIAVPFRIGDTKWGMQSGVLMTFQGRRRNYELKGAFTVQEFRADTAVNAELIALWDVCRQLRSLTRQYDIAFVTYARGEEINWIAERMKRDDAGVTTPDEVGGLLRTSFYESNVGEENAAV